MARTLSVPDFDDYNVAVSSVLVLTSLATLGLEKYALRCLTAWHNHQDWARSSGYLQFSRRLILVTSLVRVVLFCVTLELTLTLRGKPYHVAIVIVAMFLPALAMFQFILEVAAAYGGQLKGVASYRLLFPALLLLLNAGVWILLAASGGISAAFCYGAAWLVAIAVLYLTTQSYVPAPVWQAKPLREPGVWIRGALPMAAGSLVFTMLAQTGVIILELNHPDEAVVSAYAVAFQTGTFVVILATATNRLYAPRISALLDRGDFQALRTMARYRLLVIAPLTLGYLFVIIAFGSIHPVSLWRELFDRVSGALPDCARRLREHDLFAIAHLYAFHQSGRHRSRGARGKRRGQPGALHPAQRSLRGARRGYRLRGSRLAFACRLVAVRALRSRPLQACDVARDSCASAAHPLRAAPPRRTCRRAPTGWHPEAALRRHPCHSPDLGSTVSPSLPPPRCWHSRD